MRVLAHVDPVVLERELLSRVDAAHPRGAVGRTLVLVPTNRLAEHVQRRLAGVRPAWLGLEVLPFRSLGRQVLEQGAGATLHIAKSLLLEALLRRLLRERSGNFWSRFCEKRPGAAGGLLETLRELREAGIAPDDLAACADGPRERELADLFESYDVALAKAATAGWTDDAGLARAALPHVAGFAEGAGAIFVHGTYEVLGVYLDLLRELDRVAEVTVLVPAAAGTRVTTYAERFARSFLLDPDAELETVEAEGDAERGTRLAALYDEEASPPPATDSFGFRHAQGPAAEVKFAVREALRAVHDGCSPTEIVITARALEPYAAALEEAFEDAGLPWTSSLTSPLRRHPIVREFLLLLRVPAEGFKREDTVELLRSRHIRWKRLNCEAPPHADADAWSREAGILDGLEDWTTLLESWAATPHHGPEPTEEQLEIARKSGDRRAEKARRIGAALEALNETVPRDDATWSGHSAALTAALEKIFGDVAGPAADQLREILDSMVELERLAGDKRTVGFDEARRWLEDAVDSGRLTLERDDGGGIRVLDAMQLRGLTFRRLHLLGMNSGLFPRVPREDPFLPDTTRRALRQRSGRPLGLKTEGAEEEHQLLAGILGAAAERVDVSWQRADESGRAKNVSLALREIARLAHGHPEIDRVRDDAIHLPSHPAHWLDCLIDNTGMLSRDEERLMAALHSRAADAAKPLARRFTELEPGLLMLSRTQSFEPRSTEFDGRIGPFERAKPFSVSEIDKLGDCPLNFMFAGLLRVRRLEPAPTVFEIARNELGSRIHEVLEEIYGTLRDEDRFRGSTGELVARGLALLDEWRDRVFGEIGTRAAGRLPLLWELQRARWLVTLHRFIEDDLTRIGDAGLLPVSLEKLVSVELDFGEGASAEVRGKFDRLFENDDRAVVGDYKTSKSLGWRVHPTSMLKAKALQAPLYRMMTRRDADVEILGVHPELDVEEGDHRAVFSGFDNDGLKRSFEQTMRVLLDLRRDGIYPFHKDDLHCSWCDYASACRRTHPPTQEREVHLADAEAYRNVLTKSTKSPHGKR